MFARATKKLNTRAASEGIVRAAWCFRVLAVVCACLWERAIPVKASAVGWPYSRAWPAPTGRAESRTTLRSAILRRPRLSPLGRGCRSFQGSPMLHSIKQNWFANIRGDVLSGLRSEEHTSELQSRENLVCRLLLEKKK